MHLKILLPSSVLVDQDGVRRIVAETPAGMFGLLPRRLDCTAALVPGILLFEAGTGGEVCVAVDEGVLVKTGAEVLISVRNAVIGADLTQLRALVEREFRQLDASQTQMRSAMARLEAGFVRRFANFRHD